MFCTPDDFNLPPYAIPNLNLVVNSFQAYVDKKEAEVLKRLLGVQLYYEAIEGHNALPDAWAKGPYIAGDRVLYLNSIYEAIIDNENFPPDISPTEWLFIEANNWAPLGGGAIIVASAGTCGELNQQIEWLGMQDMLIPFIYYCWLRDNFDNFSGIGVVQGKAENAEVIAPARRLVDAYNEFAIKADTMHAFITSSNTPDVVYENYPYASSCGCSYPVYPGTINIFGL